MTDNRAVTKSRHPGDLVRVVLGAGVVAMSGGFAASKRVGKFETDVFRLVNDLPDVLRPPFLAATQVGALGAVPVLAGLALAARRPAMARDMAVSGTATYVAAKVVKLAVARERPVVLLASVFRRASDSGLGFPSGHTAVAFALAGAAAPYLGRTGRRAAWSLAATVAVSRLYLGVHLPLDVVGGAALGWAIAAAVHLLFGAPSGGPNPDELLAAVRAVVRDPFDLRPLQADARGSTPYVVSSAEGARFVKVITTENRDADALFKLARFITLRHVGDEAPFVTARQAAEHEAYVALIATRSGVRVPTMRGTASVGRSSVVVSDQVAGALRLDQVVGVERTLAVLPELWQQVALLHAAGVAHRDLRPANILVDADGAPWIIDFAFAQVAAERSRRAVDVAELLVTTSLLVGVEPAVDVAHSVIGSDGLAEAAPFLQPLALSASTRSALRGRNGVLGALRERVASRAEIEAPALVPLARVRPLTMFMMVGLVFAAHLFIPQIGGLRHTLDAVTHARLPWIAASVGASVATYLAATMALSGASPVPLPFGRTILTQLAASFANRLAPASIGGMGVEVRYLQRNGLERTTATTTVATMSIAGLIVHASLLVVAAVAIRHTGIGDLPLPSGWHLLAIAAAILVVVGVVMATSQRRRIVAFARAGVSQLATVLRSPARATRLFAGSLGVTGFNILALAAALAAFSAHAPIETVGIVFLVGAGTASAAPTPGGLGAVEAALVAGFTATGVASGPAIAGVLTYRLATFWLPTLPGWLAFRALRRRQQL